MAVLLHQEGCAVQAGDCKYAGRIITEIPIPGFLNVSYGNLF
jgi:hypothetical protein